MEKLSEPGVELMGWQEHPRLEEGSTEKPGFQHRLPAQQSLSGDELGQAPLEPLAGVEER